MERLPDFWRKKNYFLCLEVALFFFILFFIFFFFLSFLGKSLQDYICGGGGGGPMRCLEGTHGAP